MAIGPDAKAGFVALNRFAFGARGGAYAGDLARAASDPRGLLKAELMQSGIAHLSAPTLPTTKAALQAAFAEQERVRLARQNSTAQSPSPQMAGSAKTEPPATSDGVGTPPTPAPSDAAPAPAHRQPRWPPGPSSPSRRWGRGICEPTLWRGFSGRCAPRSVSPNAWCTSGPIIFASRPPKDRSSAPASRRPPRRPAAAGRGPGPARSARPERCAGSCAPGRAAARWARRG